MENLSNSDAEQLRDEIIDKIPKRVDQAIASIGIRTIQKEPMIYGVGILVEKTITPEDVWPFIPEEMHDNVIIQRIDGRIEAQ